MQDAAYWARQPRWPMVETLAIPGRVRGVLLRHWAEHCRRRWGSAVVAQVRAAWGQNPVELPEVVDESAWYPAPLQLALSETLITTCLDGDAVALGRLVREDTLRDFGTVQRLGARALGPVRAYAKASNGYAHLYDVGQVEAEPRDHGCRLNLHGAPLFDHPTWRVLQLWAHEVALEVLHGKPGRVQGEALPGGGFSIDVAWA
jgi:hypothetical protein